MDMTILQKSCAIAENEVNTSLNIAIFQILLSIMQVQGILYQN